MAGAFGDAAAGALGAAVYASLRLCERHTHHAARIASFWFEFGVHVNEPEAPR